MLVAFWSPLKGHGKSTTAVLSVGCTVAIEYVIRSLILDTRGTGDIENSFAELRSGSETDNSSYGIRAVETLLSSGKLGTSGVQDRCTFVVRNRLDYLDTVDAGKVILDKTILPVLERTKTEYDLRLADVGGGDLSTMEKEVLNRSDLVIVCLPQNINLVTRAMPLVNEVVKNKKKLLCVGDYEPNASISLKKISKACGVPTKDVFGIPHHIGILDSLGKNHVIGFFQRVQTVKRSLFKMTEDELCITKIRELSKRVLEEGELTLIKEGE